MLSGRLFWQLRRLPRTLGWAGVAAIGLGIATVLFQFNMVHPLRDSMTELRAEAERLGARTANHRVTEASQNPGAELLEFYRFFPEGDATTDADALTDVLARIYATAAQESVVLEHGEYHLSQVQEGGLLRYDVMLPINGPYPKLRRFIAKVLQDNRSLALEGISFGRQTAVDIGVSAQVRMTLYLRAGST